ncbi:MAG: phosphatidate cytidylyltransferase [Brevinema sp.]
MIKRLLTAVLGIPVTWYIIVTPMYNDLIYVIFFLIILVALSEEILVPIEKTLKAGLFLTRLSRFAPITIFASWAMVTSILPYNLYIAVYSTVIAVFFYLCGIQYVFFTRNYPKNMELFGALCFHFVTINVFMNSMFILKFYQPNGAALVLVFVFAWVSDAAGMFSGMLFGKRELSFLPSKKKTLEGYIGSFTVCILLGILYFFVLQGLFGLPFRWPLWKWVLFGIMMSFSANFGDLVESYFKRWAGIKDSGTIIPGMGGIFDTIDSALYSAPIGILFFLTYTP